MEGVSSECFIVSEMTLRVFISLKSFIIIDKKKIEWIIGSDIAGFQNFLVW